MRIAHLEQAMPPESASVDARCLDCDLPEGPTQRFVLMRCLSGTTGGDISGYDSMNLSSVGENLTAKTRVRPDAGLRDPRLTSRP